MTLSTERLQAMRFLADPPADETIARIISAGDVAAVDEIFKGLATNASIPDDSHPEIHRFFKESPTLPADVDWERIKIGQEVFMAHGPTILLSLFSKSLPECYACGNGAEVLYRTGRLTLQGQDYKRYARRLMETAQFVVDVMWEGAFTEEGTAYLAIHKIRLIHAAIRYYLRKKGWDEATLGTPINQEDAAGTLLSFSASVLEGIQVLHVDLTEEEIDGYMYLWAEIGRLMGIEEELIPTSYEDGLAKMNLIFDHQLQESEGGKLLVDACHKFMDYVIPGNVFDEYPKILTHRMVQSRVSEALDLHHVSSFKGRLMFRLTQVFAAFSDDMEDEFGFVRGMTHRFGKRFLQGIFEYYNGWKKIEFRIPPSLRQDWEDHHVVHPKF